MTNKNALNVRDNMNNLMILLNSIKIIYYYKNAKIITSTEDQLITWENHKSDRANCGSSFTTLEQYKHILKTGAYHCILFDGSLLRSSFVFKNNFLISNSHLWWPAPFNIYKVKNINPQETFDEFILDPNWVENISMRSPIRVDFDSEIETDKHSMVHLHTQHHNSRLYVKEPVCFSRFVQYILKNFYPDIEINFLNWNYLNFTYNRSKMTDSYFSKVEL